VASINVCVCFGVPPRECRSFELGKRTNIQFLVELGKSGNEIREMLVQVYGDKPPMTFFSVPGNKGNIERREF